MPNRIIRKLFKKFHLEENLICILIHRRTKRKNLVKKHKYILKNYQF